MKAKRVMIPVPMRVDLVTALRLVTVAEFMHCSPEEVVDMCIEAALAPMEDAFKRETRDKKGAVEA